MAASKYVTNTLPQCSSASVGLAQAHPNYICLHGVAMHAMVTAEHKLLKLPTASVK